MDNTFWYRADKSTATIEKLLVQKVTTKSLHYVHIKLTPNNGCIKTIVKAHFEAKNHKWFRTFSEAKSYLEKDANSEMADLVNKVQLLVEKIELIKKLKDA